MRYEYLNKRGHFGFTYFKIRLQMNFTLIWNILNMKMLTQKLRQNQESISDG